MKSQVWITGLGLVTPLGPDVESTWKRLIRGDRAIRPVTLFDVASQRVGLAAQVDGVVLPDGAGDVTASWSRTSVMALSAAREAMQMAGLDARTSRVGLVVGGTTGGMLETEQILARLHGDPDCHEALAGMLSHPLTATAARLDERMGPFACIRTLSSACSSGANAIVVGALWVLSGDVDAAVVGGADGLCRLTLSGFNSLGVIAPEPCRPFDRVRRGTSLGEGAGFLVLERSERAQSRGARPTAALAGWALGAEAHHVTHPAPDGRVMVDVIHRAMTRACIGPSEIDYVNAHGTGTPVNDPVEAAALARALGAEALRVPVSSSKGQIGHALGASGAIEAVFTTLVVARRMLVPTAGLDQPDLALDLVHVPHVGRRVQRVRSALSNAFGFGGMDTVLVFADPEWYAAGGSRSSTRSAATNAIPGGTSLAAPATVVITGAAVLAPGEPQARLGFEECAVLPERTASGGRAVDPDTYLDLARARRLTGAGRLGAVVVEHVIAQSDAPREGMGVVLGSAFGNIDGSAAFMHRIFEKGARSASPAEFPVLVPSSPVGQVSIYAQLCGPCFAIVDLSASAESAFVVASQLVAGGEAIRIVAGAAEPRSVIGERVLSG
ncbi:MAG: beta-ketoacyl synthase N-terminal-like domain-containing protein, partial [Polyangiaceae bacterium]